jgi:hypothetical protein
MSFPNESSLSKKPRNYNFPSRKWTKKKRGAIKEMLRMIIRQMNEEQRKGERNFILKPSKFVEKLSCQGVEIGEWEIKGALRVLQHILGPKVMFKTRCKGGRKNYHFIIRDALPELRKLIKKI